MVEQRTLTPLVLVRIQVPQPTWTKACIFLQAFVFIEFFEFERSIFRTRRKTVFFARKPLIFRRFADFCRILKFIERIAQFITDSASALAQHGHRPSRRRAVDANPKAADVLDKFAITDKVKTAACQIMFDIPRSTRGLLFCMRKRFGNLSARRLSLERFKAKAVCRR